MQQLGRLRLRLAVHLRELLLVMMMVQWTVSPVAGQLSEDQPLTHVTILSSAPEHFAGTPDRLIIRSNLQVMN